MMPITTTAGHTSSKILGSPVMKRINPTKRPPEPQFMTGKSFFLSSIFLVINDSHIPKIPSAIQVRKNQGTISTCGCILYFPPNGRAQRRGRSVADVWPCTLTTEKRKEAFAPSVCSEWLGLLFDVDKTAVIETHTHMRTLVKQRVPT